MTSSSDRAFFTFDDSCHAPFDRQARVEPDDVHAEADRGVGHQAADGAEADDAERAARQLESREVLLAGFHGLAQLFVGPFEALREIPRFADLPARQDQTRRRRVP